MRLLKFLLLEIPAQLPGEVPEGGVAERKPIVATKLRNLGEDFNSNFGNGLEEKKIVAMKLPKMKGKKVLWQPSFEIGEKKI